MSGTKRLLQRMSPLEKKMYFLRLCERHRRRKREQKQAMVKKALEEKANQARPKKKPGIQYPPPNPTQ